MTQYLSSDEAAELLGVRSGIAANKVMASHGALNQTVNPNGRATYLKDDVIKVVVTRYMEANRRHPDLASYARETRRQLRPDAPETVLLADGRRVPRSAPSADEMMAQIRTDPRSRIVSVGTDPVWLFGQAALTAAASPRVDGCRHCLAVALTPPGVDLPGVSPEFIELLGPACERCKRNRSQAAASRPVTASASRATGKGPGGRPAATTPRKTGYFDERGTWVRTS